MGTRKLGIMGLVFILSGLWPILSLASDDVMVFTEDGTSTSEVPSQARSESLTSALDRGGLEAIGKIIGITKVDKNLNTIKAKVFPESGKYIQYYKASEPVAKNGLTSLNVTIKISMGALREILDRAGLLVQSDDIYLILPVIKIQERKGKSQRSYVWWRDDDLHSLPIIRDQLKPLLSQWQAQDIKDFRILDPQSRHLYAMVPDRFKRDNITSEEALLMAQSFKVPLMLMGDIDVTYGDKPGKTKSMAKISAYNVNSGRLLFDITKSYEVQTQKNNNDLALQQVMRATFADLSHGIHSQFQDAFKRGDFGSQTIRILVKGDLNYMDLENFKTQMTQRIPELRSLRERFLQRKSMALEGDLIGSIGQMVKKIEGANFENFDLSIQNVTMNEVDLSWSKNQTRKK